MKLRAAAVVLAAVALAAGWRFVLEVSAGDIRSPSERDRGIAITRCREKVINPPAALPVDRRAPARVVTGTVLAAFAGRGDERDSLHEWMDTTVLVAPDAEHRYLMGPANRMLEIEAPLNEVPPQLWPAPGDWVVGSGPWMWPCAEGERYRTEIRPAGMLLSLRNRGAVDPRRPQLGHRAGIVDLAPDLGFPVPLTRAALWSGSQARPVTIDIRPPISAPSPTARLIADFTPFGDSPAPRIAARRAHVEVTVGPSVAGNLDVYWDEPDGQPASLHRLTASAVNVTSPMDDDECAELHLWQMAAHSTRRLLSACISAGETRSVDAASDVWMSDAFPRTAAIVKGFECDHAPLPCGVGASANDDPGTAFAIFERDGTFHQAPGDAISVAWSWERRLSPTKVSLETDNRTATILVDPPRAAPVAVVVSASGSRSTIVASTDESGRATVDLPESAATVFAIAASSDGFAPGGSRPVVLAEVGMRRPAQVRRSGPIAAGREPPDALPPDHLPPLPSGETVTPGESEERELEDVGFFGTIVEVGGDARRAVARILRERRFVRLEGLREPPPVPPSLLWPGLAVAPAGELPPGSLVQSAQRSPPVWPRVVLIVLSALWVVWVLGLLSQAVQRARARR